MDSAMSPADMRAVLDGSNCGYGDGWGGGMGGWWMIILFALIFGGGGGFGFNNRGNCASTEDLASGFNFSALQGKTNDILAAVNGVNQNLGNAICSSTYELASKIDNCCCNTQAAIQQVRYDMAVQNGDIKSLIHSEAEATRNLMQQNKIESLQQQINALNLQTALCGIPRTSPYGYGIYTYPACSGYNTCGNCAY